MPSLITRYELTILIVIVDEHLYRFQYNKECMGEQGTS